MVGVVFRMFGVVVAWSGAATAQEALRTPEIREPVPAAARLQQEQPDYLLKWHDIRFQARPSLTLEYNDNINVSPNRVNDYIIRPTVDFSAYYPLTSWNALRVSVGLGYDKYINHDEWSQFRIEQRSAIEFDFMVKDWRFNAHDRFEQILDPAREASFAGPGRYAGLQNMAGVSGTWTLKNLEFTLAYDHLNWWSSYRNTDYLNRSSELPVVRAGYQILPNFTAGLEGTYTFTTYEQPRLNNYSGLSAGIYADWQAGRSIRVQPRAGFVNYIFEQTSSVLMAQDQSSWYVGIAATHLFKENVSYTINSGHEIRPGTLGDAVEDWYASLGVSWNFMRNASLTGLLSYETGKQSSGNLSEEYNHLGAGVGISCQFIRNLSTRLDYRRTIRNSNSPGRDYTQNMVSLSLNYHM
jgi:hypothetical protein